MPTLRVVADEQRLEAIDALGAAHDVEADAAGLAVLERGGPPRGAGRRRVGAVVDDGVALDGAAGPLGDGHDLGMFAARHQQHVDVDRQELHADAAVAAPAHGGAEPVRAAR